MERHFGHQVVSLINSSLAPKTHEVYKQGIVAFSQFRQKFNIQPCWPIPVSDILYFISHLALLNLSYSTVNCYISGISFFSKLNDFEDLTQKFIVKKMLQGLKRSRHHKRDIRMPITKDMLIKIVQILPSVCSSRYEAALFTAAYSVAFFGLFRVSELTFDPQLYVSRHCLSFENVVAGKDSLHIFLSSSKTDQLGVGTTIKLQQQSPQTICPVKSCLAYLKSRPPASGPFFCHLDGTPLSRYQFAAVLKKAIASLGIPAKFYQTHSFRIGSATDLSLAGFSDDQIRSAGRWKSQAFASYLRPAFT